MRNEVQDSEQIEAAIVGTTKNHIPLTATLHTCTTHAASGISLFGFQIYGTNYYIFIIIQCRLEQPCHGPHCPNVPCLNLEMGLNRHRTWAFSLLFI